MTEADKDHALLAVKAFEAAVNATHLVALLRAGAIFINGKLVERPGQDSQPKPLKDLDPQVLLLGSMPVPRQPSDHRGFLHPSVLPRRVRPGNR